MTITEKEWNMSQLWPLIALVMSAFHRLSSIKESEAETHLETGHHQVQCSR